MELRKVLEGVEINEMNADVSTDIKGIVQNSKKVEEGFVFVAVKGARIDGRNYIDSAIEKGAILIVTDKKPDSKVPFVITPDPRKALSLMLSNFYSRPEKSFKYSIAVTGTNGKTSTTIMLKNIFEEAGYKVGLIGTVKYLIGDEEYDSETEGNHLTTPDAENFWSLISTMRDKGVEVLIMEASSHALALDKFYGMHFSAGAFTNLTRDHLDFHLDFENYLLAKSKLFSMCDVAIINDDDNYSSNLISLSKCPVKTYSIDKNSTSFTAKNTKYKGAQGIEYELLTENLLFRIKVDIPGTFTVYNSLAAASVALTLEIPCDAVINGLKKTNRVDGRMDKVDIDAPFSVIIDFAHTPDAMEKVLETVKGFAEGRIITLFGCGGDRDKTKRSIMGKIATEMSDMAIITSDNSRTEKVEGILSDIVSGIEKDNYKVVPDRKEAIITAIDMATEKDVILCLGKGHEEYEIDADGKHPFSERDIVIEYFNEKRGK